MHDWQSFESAYPLLGRSLRMAKNAGRLAHSHLVVSSNAAIRNRFPTLLAQLAVCLNPLPDGAPCGHCETCSLLENGLYPDLFLLAPTSKSRQIVIGNDDSEPDTLRNFESMFHLSSSAPGGWKIGVIQDCDTMNENAQNAFLKTLEEPPRNCLFILTTGHPASLLPTIRSRCQILSLTDNVCKYDMETFSAMPELLMKLTFASKGDLVAGEDCAAGLIDILGSLGSMAEATVQARWDDRLKSAENLESAAIKLIEKRMDGETGCEYLRLREEFLSILHTWFAQIALVSEGTPLELLPNPEVVRVWLDADPRPAISPDEAARMLVEAENLVRVLNTNVNDELAVRAFALSVAIDTGVQG